MKQSARCYWLAGITAVLGAAAAAVRSLYFNSALEEGGFLTPFYPLQILFWILAGIMVVTAVCFSAKLNPIRRSAPMGIYMGLSSILLSLCIGLTAGKLTPDLRFSRILQILGGITAVLLLADGICRTVHKSLGIFPYSLFCIFLMAYSIAMYGQWSNVPEMERILVPAVGQILLIPLACERASWDMGKNSDGRLLFLSAAAGFFCISAIGCPGVQVLHLGGVVWSIGTILALRGEGEM